MAGFGFDGLSQLQKAAFYFRKGVVSNTKEERERALSHLDSEATSDDRNKSLAYRAEKRGFC
jgi:hypothetical protein